jgi:hypothetical protein
MNSQRILVISKTIIIALLGLVASLFSLRAQVGFASIPYWEAQSNEWARGKFVVNDQSQARQMDLTFQSGSASNSMGKVCLAAYELRGDELLLTAAEPGNTLRPPSLHGAVGVRVFKLKQQ